MTEPIILLPRYYADRIVKSGKAYGFIDARHDGAEHVLVVDGFVLGQDQGAHHGGSDWVGDRHYLRYATRVPGAGAWYRVHHLVHDLGREASVRRAAFDLDTFRDGLEGGWVHIGATQMPAITYAERPDGTGEWAAWMIDGDQGMAARIDLQLIDEEMPLLAPLVDHWPLFDIADEHVVLVGAGSIGSATADALAAYGVRRFTLVDPDRLLNHNFARHRAHPEHLGRRKVIAERKRLLDRDPTLDIDALPADVIDDADLMRPLFAGASLIVVTSDGVDSRRAANHLARRAGKPVVFACVLMNGSYGEVLRVPTPGVGCLLCARAALVESGAMANPEEHLDRAYGTGTRHLPMTAVGGDLGLVGQLAAKTAVATLLHAKGHADQRLPGDHAILGLRPRPGLAAPFDIEFAGEIRWSALPPPRPDCPSCSTAT